MAYIRSFFESLDKRIMMVKKYHTRFVLPENPKVKQRRMPKVEQTTEKQAEVNNRQRIDKYFRLLADNFHAGDFWLTLTTEEAMTPEDFKGEMRGFMKRLRRFCKRKTESSLKYFRVLENLIKGRPHADILIPKICSYEEMLSAIKELWTAGFAKLVPYGGAAEDAHQLASYYCKQNKKEHGAKIDTSRKNLIRREPKKKIIHAETFRDEIKAPQGYEIVKKLSYTIQTETGPYQVAVFRKVEDRKGACRHDRW